MATAGAATFDDVSTKLFESVNIPVLFSAKQGHSTKCTNDLHIHRERVLEMKTTTY